MYRLITLSGILRDGILLLVRKYRLITSTQYQGREKDENFSRKLNSSSPRPTFAENKGKKENRSFFNQNAKQGEIHSIKRKRDENVYDIKNGIQKVRQNNGFSDNYYHDNEHSSHTDGRRNRIFLDDDGDGGDDENEYINQERQKVSYLGRNNNIQNNGRKTVNVKNQNWEDDDEDADDDDIGYSDRGRISSGNHLMGKKTVGGRDSSREYDNVNGHGNENERGRGKGSEGGGIGDYRYGQNSGARREDREDPVQRQGGGRGQGGEKGEGRGGGRGQGQEEGKGEGQGVGDSVESVMVWAMALVGESVLPLI
jgi:hypothetical protein